MEIGKEKAGSGFLWVQVFNPWVRVFELWVQVFELWVRVFNLHIPSTR